MNIIVREEEALLETYHYTGVAPIPRVGDHIWINATPHRYKVEFVEWTMKTNSIAAMLFVVQD